MPDTGAPWNIPYVASTDLVSDWPADSLALANAIDAGLDAANVGIGSNVVQTVKTDTFSTSSTSYTPITGLSVSITPTSATSKVLIVASVPVGGTLTTAQVTMLQLKRGATALVAPTTPSNRTPAFTAPMFNYSGAGDLMIVHSFHYLDSPATTSSTTYSVDMRVNAQTGYVNRSVTDTDTSSFPRGVATITAIEVAA